MAKAPRPGSRAQQEAAQQFIRLKVKDRELDVMLDLTMEERFVVRHSTGMPVEAFIPSTETEFGEDSLFVLWWVGRRQNGEPGLSFAQAQTEWPKGLVEGDLELALIDLGDEDEKDDSPESSGPGSSVPGPASPTTSDSAPGTSTA